LAFPAAALIIAGSRGKVSEGALAIVQRNETTTIG
jgi:hypothetical protein